MLERDGSQYKEDEFLHEQNLIVRDRMESRSWLRAVLITALSILLNIL